MLSALPSSPSSLSSGELNSIHIPFVLILGVLYFWMKFAIDAHLLLNLYKNEIESSGRLIHNACLKTIFSLAFFQFCMMLKQFGSSKFISGSVILVIFVFTIAVYMLYSDRFLRPELFNDEEFRMDKAFIESWKALFSHPLVPGHDKDLLQPNNQSYNNVKKDNVSLNNLKQSGISSNTRGRGDRSMF